MSSKPGDLDILVTNDDGVHAPALAVLKAALSALGRVTIVVPDRDQSATSHSLTLHRPLRIHRHGDERYSVDGTPTDCVLIAYHGLLERPPDVVVSGINHGPNMGEDVFYSGTVAAAIEGAMQGAPAIAASLVTREPADFAEPARFIARLVAEVTRRKLGGKRVLNVNLPHRPWNEIRGVRPTRLGTRVYSDSLIAKTDPRGRAYYWIGGQDPVWETAEGTDFHAVSEGYVSVTPLVLDLTDTRAVEDMRGWNLEP
jgi:5'-nucleotidase